MIKTIKKIGHASLISSVTSYNQVKLTLYQTVLVNYGFSGIQILLAKP